MLAESYETINHYHYRKARAASAQSLALWQQATIEIIRCTHSIIAYLCHIHMGVVLRAHPVRGESHIQRDANGEVATLFISMIGFKVTQCIKI